MARERRRLPTRVQGPVPAADGGYRDFMGGIADLLDTSRRTVARAANSVLVATYWEIGRRIVEFEQGGAARAEYGEELLRRLSHDLVPLFGRGFSLQGLYKMRTLFAEWQIFPTLSGKLQGIDTSTVGSISFPLSWSHYVRPMAVRDPALRQLYESEAIRSAWSVRQLDRQISTQFFERVKASSDPERLLAAARRPQPSDPTELKHHLRDPYLLELGAGFTFMARQWRLRIGDEWYRLGISAQVFASRYLTVLPDPEALRREFQGRVR